MRALLLCLCCCLPLAAVCVPAWAAAPAPAQSSATAQQAAVQKKLARTKKQIAALARKQRETTGRRNTINGALAAQADKLSAAAKAVHASDRAIADNRHQLEALRKRRDTLEAGLDRQRKALAELLRAAYMVQPGSDLRLLLGDADVAKLARALAYSRYFRHDRVRHIRALLTRLHDLDQTKQSIIKKREALEAARKQRQDRVARLTRARRKQKTLLAGVEARLKDQHQRMRQLQRNRQSLKHLLAKLRDVFADIPDKLPGDIPFARRRGKLPWPVHGKARRQGDGVHISARRGATIHAVAHGRVAYADWLRGYGLLVIIDHGNGWMSLYGDNESLLTSVGNWVRAGQPIATAGADVGDDSGVYFALRHNGKAVNPLPWLAKHP